MYSILSTVDGRLKKVEKHALHDFSIEVKEGEVFGIIGRNGAGKSTLLRILSRITVPTSGRAVVYGRVASLLEVGTGMHPEMTGRENIFLNGALLGMSKADIRTKLEEIIEFAGVPEYIDTPIKRYSSGMKLRLAFAVAAHLAADVMIVDEVLAVGDAEFQSKCLGVMREGIGRGRTTLFVSHNMAAVENLCSRICWIENGEVGAIGPSQEVVQNYLKRVGQNEQFEKQLPMKEVSLKVRFLRVSVRGAGGSKPQQGEDILVTIGLLVSLRVRKLQILLTISSVEGIPVCGVCNGDYRAEWDLSPGLYEVTVRLTSNRLMPRTYKISLRSFEEWGAELYEDLPDILTFEVIGRDVLGTGVLPLKDRGITWMPATFEISAPREEARAHLQDV